MFEALRAQPADALLPLIKAYAQDRRIRKVDLGVGVYRNEFGETPVMSCVKAAERILLDQQTSKCYLGPEGDLGFVALLQSLIFGKSTSPELNVRGIQTPGGGGALRLGAELIAAANPNAKVLLGMPSWPNHAPIFAAVGLAVQQYAFVDLRSQSIEFDCVVTALNAAAPGDVVLLHGCCHNPTGIDFNGEQWKAIAEIISARALVPFIDLAYQGLGEGLEQDVSGLREVLARSQEALVAYSCDKNFGLYRERVGALYCMGRKPAEMSLVQSNMSALVRVNWSMPPDHGAAIVRTILADSLLTDEWQAEVAVMRRRINDNRTILAAAHPALAFVGKQRGLFSILEMSKSQAAGMRQNHGVYLADSGRINIAGMQPGDAEFVIGALVAEGVLAAP